jgi:hypothetical protein
MKSLGIPNGEGGEIIKIKMVEIEKESSDYQGTGQGSTTYLIDA